MGESFGCLEDLICLKNTKMGAGLQETAVGYACLILTDQKLEVTADKITAIGKAAGIAVEPLWAQTFERVLKDRSLDDLLEAATSGGGGGGGGAAPASGDAAPAEVAVPAAAAAPEEESEQEMELDLFG